MTQAIIIIILLLVVPCADGNVNEPAAPADYAQALETANAFLWAWSNRDAESGIKLISQRLLTEFRKNDREDWFRQYMTGLSNPHHLSFEIAKGKAINSKRFAFPVTLFEYYTGEPKAFQYKSRIEVIKEGDSWRIDLLPATSDNE